MTCGVAGVASKISPMRRPPFFDPITGIAALMALICAASTPAAGQEWKALHRHLYAPGGTQTRIDAPQGYRVLDAPEAGAQVLREVPGPLTVEVSGYVERGKSRFYLTPEASELMWEEKPFYWIEIPGTGRAEFIEGTTPATLLKRETRDFFKTGPETAEIYEETVNLATETEWGPGYRRAEVDFLLPVKVVAFRPADDDSWELELTVYPAFDSNVDRIPGPRPELYGEPHEALITRPVQRATMVKGPAGAEKFAGVFAPETVWAASFSEGRLQQMRLGWNEVEAPMEVSRLSPPHFTRSDPMSFRFQVNRLLAAPVTLTLVPDRIVGADITVYDGIAELGGPPAAGEEGDLDRHIHRLWNVTVGPDLALQVVAPLLDGRGAAGMLELESIGLGPTFEEELKALAAFAKADAPLLPPPGSDEWLPVLEHKLGPVPASQRGEESAHGF